jgi:hypothetical protein
MLGVQARRFAGFTFIALYAYGVLPGAFAWPAGLGDIAVGLTAPVFLVALLRRPAFAASNAYLVWNGFGALDLVTAVGVGAINTALAGGVGASGSTSVMAELPLC